MDCPRVGIIVGHHPKAPGAVMNVEGIEVSEYELWKDFGRELVHTFCTTGLNATLIKRPNPRPDSALGRRIRHANIDFGVELHFNAVADPDVSGTLTIYRDGHEPSKRLAKEYQRVTREILSLRDRATVPRNDLGIMRHTSEEPVLPLILVEPAFGSRPKDAATLVLNESDLMKAYRQAAVSFAHTLGQ